MAAVVCPKCGTDDHLAGERRGDMVRITCSACCLVWDRDPAPRCPGCGSTEVRPVPEPVWAKVRGNQRSIVAYKTVYLCTRCDSVELKEHLGANPMSSRESGIG
ncbi:MAG: hypothetical protein WD602_00370 [Actinomycetota bacterium]